MKVLLAAYSCRPNVGSEPGAAWNIATRLANQNDVWVITRRRYANEITGAEANGIRFVFHDIPWLLPAKRLPGGQYFYHYLWHLSLKRIVRRLQDATRFDVVHHLTLGSFRYPSGLRHAGVPLIIGPVGGAEEPPFRFWLGLGARGFLSEVLRWISNRLATVDPLVRSSYRQAHTVLAVSPMTRDRLSKIVPEDRIKVLPQSGVQDTTAAVIDRPDGPDQDRVEVLFVGRLIPWKGAHLAIRAVAMAQETEPRIYFTILGEGPAEKSLRRLMTKVRISNTQILGRLPHIKDVYRLYEKSDIFLFPSLHESGGMSVLEAMSRGLPVICMDLGGPSITVTADCGFKAPAGSPRRAISEMADALCQLARSRQMRIAMGDAARQRVASYTWDVKAAAIQSEYASLSVAEL